MDPIKDYVENLLKEAGTWDMPENLRTPIVQNLMVQAQRRIGLAAMEAMNEKDADECASFLGTKPPPEPEAVATYIQSKIPDFDEVMKQTLAAFADEYIEGAKRLLAQAQAKSAAV